MMFTDPFWICLMLCVLGPREASGLLGPMGLAYAESPLELPMYSLPCGVRCKDDGYQPDGMKPSTWLFPGVATFTTAMQLLSALATKSMLFLLSSASPFGVEPSGAFGVR